jgi:hypothetical protein
MAALILLIYLDAQDYISAPWWLYVLVIFFAFFTIGWSGYSYRRPYVRSKV